MSPISVSDNGVKRKDTILEDAVADTSRNCQAAIQGKDVWIRGVKPKAFWNMKF